MTNNRALSADSARTIAREESETKIRSAFRRGMMITCEIAKELSKLLHEELYTDITADWNEYVTDYLQISISSYRRIVEVSQTVAQLQADGTELPANETQVAELARLEAPLRTKVWSNLISKAEQEEKKLTVFDVRRAVEAVKSAPSGLEVDMDNGSEPAAKPSGTIKGGQLILSEKGEAALNRVRKICGNDIADAIEDGTKAMTERDIRAWSDYDDSMMQALVFFLFDQSMPLHKSVNFLTREISDSTEVHDLIMVASARGGTARVNVGNRATITVELAKA